MVRIKSVLPNSLCAKAGICENDFLIKVNGNEITDVLDYKYYTSDKKLTLLLSRNDVPFEKEIRKKDEYDDLGLEFESYLMDKQHCCKNKCIFCFIDQNPCGMRDTVYFKDDDSRMSFFYGNYVTLTNLSQKDIDRIIKMRISPVNISVHTTNPELRVKMMKNKFAGESLKYLDDFYKGQIMMNCQIVLCKNVNDGKELERSLSDLAKYYPFVESIAVVPSGLTCYREGLFKLEEFSPDDCNEVISIIDKYGAENLEKFGTRLVYASDEWYVRAGKNIPKSDYYEEYMQLENGVGMIRSMSDEIDDEIDYLSEIGFLPEKDRKVSVVTGEAAYKFISESVEKIKNKWYNFNCSVYLAKNLFFGGGVTVAGLLTGSDLVSALSDKDLGNTLFIPSVMLRHEKDKFLDDMTVPELSEKLGVEICDISNDGREFTDKILGYR